MALNILQSGVYTLSCIGDTNCTLSDIMIMSQATPLYINNLSWTDKMLDNHWGQQKMWAKKVSRIIESASKLSSLPPTTELFAPNAVHAHLQVTVWIIEESNGIKSSMNGPMRFWMNTSSLEMYSTPISDDVTLAHQTLYLKSSNVVMYWKYPVQDKHVWMQTI